MTTEGSRKGKQTLFSELLGSRLSPPGKGDHAAYAKKQNCLGAVGWRYDELCRAPSARPIVEMRDRCSCPSDYMQKRRLQSWPPRPVDGPVGLVWTLASRRWQRAMQCGWLHGRVRERWIVPSQPMFVCTGCSWTQREEIVTDWLPAC